MKTKDWFPRFGLLRLRPQCAALLVVNLFLGAFASHAQPVWRGTVSPDWNNPLNWNTNSVPAATGQANFGSSGTNFVKFEQSTMVGSIVFNGTGILGTGYVFQVADPISLTITGSGITVNKTPEPTFNVTSLGSPGVPALSFESGTAGPATYNVTNTAAMVFHGTSTAGPATINAGLTTDQTGFQAGFIMFRDSSTAGTATITANVDSNIEFHDKSNAGTAMITATNKGFIFFNETSTAGNATLINDGGYGVDGVAQIVFGHIDNVEFFGGTPTAGDATIITNSGGITAFENEGQGGNARFITNAGGTVDISALTTGGTTAGSIEGAGTYKLGKNEFTVGSNNLSTTVSGLIEDGGQAGGTGGSLVKVGTGTLTLLGDNTFSGGTTIQNGVVVVGNLPGSQNEALGISTALGTGNVNLTGGVLRATTLDPITIVVGNNYTQGGNGILQLGIAGTKGSQYDRIQAGGTASVGGALQVFGLNFAPSVGNAFAVVTASGGRIGGTEFSTVNDEEFNTHGLQRVDLYLHNAVVLLYVSSHVPPGPQPEPSPQPPGVTPPVPPTEEPPPINEEEDNVVLPPVDPNQPIPESEVVQLVDPTAEELTSLYEISFSAANMQRFNLGDRMFQIQQSVVPPPPVPPIPTPTLEKGAEGKGVEGKAPPPAPPSPINRWGVWANGWGDFVNVDSTSTAQGYRFTTGGVSAGVDYLVIPNHFAVGLFGGYSHSWINFTPSGSADNDTGRGGLYATYFNQGWWVDAAVWGGGTDYSTSRQALAGTANGSTSGWEFSTFGEAGYDIHCGALAFGPTVAMQFTRVFLNGFGENGSLVPLDIHGAGQNSLRTDVGGRVYYKWLVGNIPVIPTVNLGWEHEYKYSTLDIGASAPILDTSTTFSGPNIGHDSLIINAGISVQWTPRIWTTIGYDGDVARDHYNSNAVAGTFSFSF